MSLLAVSDAVTYAPVAFLLGVLVGLVLASRYRISRMNGKAPP
jgi:hypothetical protein